MNTKRSQLVTKGYLPIFIVFRVGCDFSTISEVRFAQGLLAMVWVLAAASTFISYKINRSK